MNYIDECVQRYPTLAACRQDMQQATEAIIAMYHRGGKLLLCGNGGSAADCDHIAGELLKGFLLPRAPDQAQLPGLEESMVAGLQLGVPAIPLPDLTAVQTAYANDADPTLSFAQLTLALGRPADIFLGISTSGNAENVCAAARTANAMGLYTMALTGAAGGALAPLCRCAIRVPEIATYKIQEYHLPVYHAICAQVEQVLFGQN